MDKVRDPFDVSHFFWGGEEKGQPGALALGLVEEHVKVGCILDYRKGRTLPWVAQEGAINLQTSEFHPLGRPRCFKTKPNAERYIHTRKRAEIKAPEKQGGALPAEARTPGQKTQEQARIKAIRKWFPDTTAVQEQVEKGERTREQDQACRKALAADLARLRRTLPKEILEDVPMSPDFMAVLAKASHAASPLDPMEEELALNWLAKYNGEVFETYEDVMKEATGIKYSNDAIRKRAQRMGLHVVK